MGYYIQTNSHKNKAQWLVANAKGVITRTVTPSYDSIPVIVVDNGMFEAAGICFNKSEFKAFTNPGDTRPRTIVMVPRDEVIRLSPEVERMLNW